MGENVRLVSLGCTCGPKLSFQQLGRGAETLPFDWVISRLKGVLHFMRNDFGDFFDYVTMKPDCGGMTMYRSRYHSFWHDNPDDDGMRERYGRRIDRFENLFSITSQPVLFVRVVASTDELQLVEELLDEVTQRFGDHAHLLVILDFQMRISGPAIVLGTRGKMMLYYHAAEDREPAHAPYQKPVKVGLQWAAGKAVNCTTFGTMRDAIEMADKNAWGYTAHGGVRSFEDEPIVFAAPTRISLRKC